MVSTICLSRDDPNRLFDYCPSLGVSIAATVLFALITFTHTFLATTHRKPFCWVLIMGALWETAGYAIRSYNITSQSSSGIYTAQFLLILLAPLWINAFIYMTMGRMIHFFLPAGEDKIFGVRARKVTKIFVWFDVTAFIVQLAGGLMSSGNDTPVKTAKMGLNIYTGGVGLQLAFIAVFCAIGFQFQRVLKRQDVQQSRQAAMESVGPYNSGYQHQHQLASDTPDSELSHHDATRCYTTAKPLLLILSLALSLIILRNVYRLIEYAMGGVNGNTITRHEWWMYVFDALPMFAALIVLAAYHPGRILQGARCDFAAEDKLEKQKKKSTKLAKQAKKDAKKGGKVYMEVKRDESPNASAEQLV